jgi:hypothetical protein
MPTAYLGKMADSKPQVAMLQPEIHPAWQGRSIAGPRLRLVEFSAFLEQQLQPDTDSVRHGLEMTICISYDSDAVRLQLLMKFLEVFFLDYRIVRQFTVGERRVKRRLNLIITILSIVLPIMQVIFC